MKYRLYSIVLRHLSGIQKGIQHGHSKDEYENFFSKDKEYQQWLKKDKTVIVLQTNSCQEILDAEKILRNENIKCKVFYEPDLGNIPTSISFLVDERAWKNEELNLGYSNEGDEPDKDFEYTDFFENFLECYCLATN